MKKVLMSLSLVAFLAVTVSSCLKNDSTPSVRPVDPETERPALNAFNDSTGFNMIEVTDSLSYYVYDRPQNLGILKNAYAPYIQYEILDPGNMGPGTTEVPNADLGGDRSGNTTVYNTLSDTTLIVSCTYKGTLLDGDTFDSTKAGDAYLAFLPEMIASWQVIIGKVGRGGHIRFVTPSIYGYGTIQKPGIPVNSPLYFDVYVKGFVHNNYLNK